MLLCTTDMRSESIRNVFVVCIALGHRFGIESLSHAELELIQRRLSGALNSMGELGPNIEYLAKALGLAGGLTIKIEDQQPISTSSVDVPAGYKSVGWIKLQEAELVLKASETRTHLAASGATPSFRVEYFDPNSIEARKFHSTTRLVRLRRGEESKSFWIRPEEAATIVEAWTSAKSLEFAHLDYGNGGLVQFHEPTSEASVRFRSCTRLLRKY